jgi:adenylate cyclase
MTESPSAYIPADRLHAIARGVQLPERARGAALFADISGFTPLTEALVLALGPQRGAEELPRQLNLVYNALVAEVHRYGGSVLGFAGDAITCWFEAGRGQGIGDRGQGEGPGQSRDVDPGRSSADSGGGPSSVVGGLADATLRAAAAALAMQQAMQAFAAIAIPGVGTVALAVKVAVAAGAVRRFIAGDPALQLVDVLAGATLDRLAAGEHHAEKGDVILDAAAAAALGEQATLLEWREDEASGERFAVLGGLAAPVDPAPWPLFALAVSDEELRPWLLPPVYERLQAGLGEFLTELRPAVALFLRFGGIDFDNDELAPLKLDAYIRWLQRVLRRYDAFMLQLTIGDKGCYLYAAFGAPSAHEDDAVRACMAALELRESRLDFVQGVQIGVSQGRMRTGAYGALDRRTYGSLGDEVNMAARLMQHAPLGQVLVNQSVRRSTGDRFAWEQLPPLRVKGKAQPVNVVRLIGPEERRSFRLQEPRYSLPMVGRAAELAAAADLIGQALGGGGRILALSADAGLGKSRLVAEIVALARVRGMTVLIGESASYGTTTSYLAWRSIWRGFFDLDPAAPTADQVGALPTRVARLDAALLPRLPLLGAALNLEIPDNDLTASLLPKLRKAALEAMLVDCLRARARQGPLLIVLEDVHWLDPLSDDLLLAIGAAVADLPVLVVLAYRPPQIPQLQAPQVSRLSHFRELTLSSLTPGEIAELVRIKLAQLFDEAPIPAGLAEHIDQQALGNPFYVEELINYLHDRGIDPREAMSLEQLELPPSLHSLILSRIDQLSEQQKSLIKVASVIGRLFRASILWGLSPFAARRVAMRADLDALSELELTPLDSPDPELTYLFKHVMTQEVAYESLPFATRSLLHGQIGEVVEQAAPDQIERMLDLLAYHYDRSENGPKRREYLLRAGDAARRAYANAAAIDYYQRAVGLLEGAERVTALLTLSKVLELVGRLDDAEARAREALALAEAQGDEGAAARCRSALAFVRYRQSAYLEARELAALAYAAFERAGAQDGMAQALGYAAVVLDRQGDYAGALAAYEGSLALWQAIGDQLNAAHVLNNMGIMLTNQGDHTRALALQEDALALRRAAGDRWGTGVSLINLGLVALNQGRLAEARDQFAEALELLRQVGDPQSLASCLGNLAFALAELGDAARARAMYYESLRIHKSFSDRWMLAYLFEDLAALEAAEEQPERALRLVGAAAALRETIGAPRNPAETARIDALLAAAAQHMDAGARESALSLGRSLSLERALSYALEELM